MTDKEADRSFILGAIAVILFLYLLWKKKSQIDYNITTGPMPQSGTSVQSFVGGTPTGEPTVTLDQNPAMGVGDAFTLGGT